MKVLPVIHIYNEGQAFSEANKIIKCGADGFWLINHHGDDVLTLALHDELKTHYPKHDIGVNLLSKDAYEATKLAIEHQVSHLWLDNAGVHSTSPDKKMLQHLQDVVIEHNIAIFAGTAFKYQKTENDPCRAARIAKSYGLIPTTSGSATGVAADTTKIRDMSCSSTQLALASGISCENLMEFAPYISHALVATAVSETEYTVDEEKLRLFVCIAMTAINPIVNSVAALDVRMKAAGMISLSGVLKSPPTPFHLHSGVIDMETFEQWLEMRFKETKSFRAQIETNEMQDDDMYEWALTHDAVFSETYHQFIACKG
jgi:hypothetical protein